MIDLSRYSASGFDRGASRLKEVLWTAVRVAFFCHSVPLPSALKAFLLRAFGADVGSGVVIRSHVSVSFPWRLKLGDHVWLGDHVTILSLAPVEVGSSVCISQRAFLCTGSHDYSKATFDLETAPIRIDDHCWIAAQCFIAPGVHIGMGSVTAAGSVVVDDVAENTIVGGNPARTIKRIARDDLKFL